MDPTNNQVSSSVSQIDAPKAQPSTVGHKLESLANKVQNAIKNFFVSAASSIKSRVIQVKKQMATDIQSGAFKENLKTFANQIKSLFKAKEAKLAKIGHEPKVAHIIVNQLKESDNSSKYETFRLSFNDLKSTLLNRESGEKIRVNNENNLQVVNRERKHQPKQSTERSQESLSKCLHTIKYGLDNGFFSVYDKEDLANLMKTLKETFAVDLDKLQGSKELRKEYKELLKQLDNHSTNELFRQAEVNFYSTNPLFENNQISANQLYELFFSGDAKISEELRSDFLLAAPWMKLFKDEKNSGFKNLVSSLVEQFKNNPSEKLQLEILNFSQQLIERGIVKNWTVLAEITMLGLSSENPKVTARSEEVVKSKVKANKNQSLEKEYRIESPSVNLAEKLSAVAKTKDKEFIKQLTHDIAVLSRNYNQVPITEITPETLGKSTVDTPTKNESIAFGNRLAAMVSSQILIGDQTNPNAISRTPAERAQLFKTFFSIAKKLETHYKDYNAATSIIGALGNADVLNTIEKEKLLGAADNGVLKEFYEYSAELTKPGKIKNKYITHNRKEESYNPHLGAFFNTLTTATELPDSKEAVGFNKMRVIASTFEQVENAQTFSRTNQNLHYNLDNFINESTSKWLKKNDEIQKTNIDQDALERDLSAEKRKIYETHGW